MPSSRSSASESAPGDSEMTCSVTPLQPVQAMGEKDSSREEGLGRGQRQRKPSKRAAESADLSAARKKGKKSHK